MMLFAALEVLRVVSLVILSLGIAVSVALFAMGWARKSKNLMVLAFAFLLLVVWWAWNGGSVGFGTGSGIGIGSGSGRGGGSGGVAYGIAEYHTPMFYNENAPTDDRGEGPRESDIDVVIAPPDTGEASAEIEDLRRQLEEANSRLAAQNEELANARGEIDRLQAECRRRNDVLSRLGTGGRPATLYLRYTGTGDPDFSAQITPAVQIRRDSSKDFNSDLGAAFETLAAQPQFKFDRLCIENAASPGASQVEEAVRAARNSFPGIRIEKIDRE